MHPWNEDSYSKNPRKVCTAESPFEAEKHKKGDRWLHPQSKYLESYSDYYSRHQCTICGHIWEEELPE